MLISLNAYNTWRQDIYFRYFQRYHRTQGGRRRVAKTPWSSWGTGSRGYSRDYAKTEELIIAKNTLKRLTRLKSRSLQLCPWNAAPHNSLSVLPYHLQCISGPWRWSENTTWYGKLTAQIIYWTYQWCPWYLKDRSRAAKDRYLTVLRWIMQSKTAVNIMTPLARKKGYIACGSGTGCEHDNEWPQTWWTDTLNLIPMQLSSQKKGEVKIECNASESHVITRVIDAASEYNLKNMIGYSNQ